MTKDHTIRHTARIDEEMFITHGHQLDAAAFVATASELSMAISVEPFERLTDEQVVRVGAHLDMEPRQRTPCEQNG